MSPDIAASVRSRLLNQAKASGEEFQLTLTRFAAERLLFRLGASAARSRCVLKGASLHCRVQMAPRLTGSVAPSLLAYADGNGIFVDVQADVECVTVAARDSGKKSVRSTSALKWLGGLQLRVGSEKGGSKPQEAWGVFY